jgi:hypothetical protein
MHRTFKAALAASGILLFCSAAFGQDVRLPRKGSSPGFEKYDIRNGDDYDLDLRHRDPPRQRIARPRSGGTAGISWEMQQEHDVIYCWRRAKRSKMAQEAAKQNVVVGYLAGGLIGAIITSSKNGEAYQDQKGDVRLEAFDRCLAKLRRRDEDDEDDDD